jgi:hypothetical protein
MSETMNLSNCKPMFASDWPSPYIDIHSWSTSSLVIHHATGSVLDIVIHFLSCTFYGGEWIDKLSVLLTTHTREVCTTFCTTFHANKNKVWTTFCADNQTESMMEEFLTSCVNIWWGCPPQKTKQLNLEI